MLKLRYGLTAILLLLTFGFGLAYYAASLEESCAIYAFNTLTPEEQDAVLEFLDRIPTLDTYYGVAGMALSVAWVGLAIGTWKVWHVKEVPACS